MLKLAKQSNEDRAAIFTTTAMESSMCKIAILFL
jgi:hypothetical protein